MVVVVVVVVVAVVVVVVVVMVAVRRKAAVVADASGTGFWYKQFHKVMVSPLEGRIFSRIVATSSVGTARPMTISLRVGLFPVV